MAKCPNYCNGYCFFHGDTGEVCDCITASGKRIAGFCPLEEHNRRLNNITAGMVKNEQHNEVMRILNLPEIDIEEKVYRIVEYFNTETVTAIEIKRRNKY